MRPRSKSRRTGWPRTAAALEAMLAKLMSRRKRVPDLIRDSRHGRVNPFPGTGKSVALTRRLHVIPFRV